MKYTCHRNYLCGMKICQGPSVACSLFSGLFWKFILLMCHVLFYFSPLSFPSVFCHPCFISLLGPCTVYLVDVFSLFQLTDYLCLLLVPLVWLPACVPCAPPLCFLVSLVFIFLSQLALSVFVACLFIDRKQHVIKTCFLFLQPACWVSCIWVLLWTEHNTISILLKP